MNDYDVIVVGAGNAAFCSALAAAIDKDAKVAILERAPNEDFGGNSRYTAGAIRFAHHGLQDLETIIDINPEERENTDFGVYTVDDFYDDMYRVTNYRCDADLVEVLREVLRQDDLLRRALRVPGDQQSLLGWKGRRG